MLSFLNVFLLVNAAITGAEPLETSEGVEGLAAVDSKRRHVAGRLEVH
jgi:hypothetical protein